MSKIGINGRTTFLALVTAITLFITGCTKKDDPEIVNRTTIDADGYTDIYTNNPSYCNFTGLSSVYNPYLIQTELLSTPLTDYIETNVKKVSGYPLAWQGVFFNCQSGTAFCAVLINIQGSYIIIKVVDNYLYYFNGTSWISTSFTFATTALNVGYNSVNTIRVAKTALNTYLLSFNGTSVVSFTETELTTGLYKGYMFTVDTQTNENFPDSFLELKFKEIYAL